MIMHLTFDFDYNFEPQLTDYLQTHDITYRIVETEITINFKNPNQLKAFLIHFDL